ncbi:MAG: phosphatase PAP2 family protein [Bdellovibrionia bacterium]
MVITKYTNTKFTAKISQLDRQAMIWVGERRTQTLTLILKAFSYSGTTKFWFGLALVLSVLYRLGIHLIPDERIFLQALFAPLVAWLVGKVIKRVINRKRPYEGIEGFQSLVKHPSCESFPSVHAASTASFATCLILLGHPMAAPIVLWTLFVSLSRYYLGVHYPSDLLGGVILGAVSGAVMSHFIV